MSKKVTEDWIFKNISSDIKFIIEAEAKNSSNKQTLENVNYFTQRSEFPVFDPDSPMKALSGQSTAQNQSDNSSTSCGISPSTPSQSPVKKKQRPIRKPC